MKVTTLFLFFFLSIGASAQSVIDKLYKQKRYEEIIAYAPKADKYGGKDIFRIGQSFIMLKRDSEAIEMFIKAMNKGYKDGEIYFAKGVAETNLERYSSAQQSFRQALYFMPKRKKVLIELAACYYKNNVLDSALKTYQTIESNWGDYWPALIMSCQILNEQGKPKKALDCYYSKLRVLERDKYYYRMALEDIMRTEWHITNNYDKAETALKNLMNAFPDQYEYHILLMQLYNETERFEKAAQQETYILEGYAKLKLPNRYYQKGAVLVEQIDTGQYQIEVFRNFQPEKHGGKLYRAFIFNYDASRPLGKIEGAQTDTAQVLSGYRLPHPLETESELTYKEFRYCMLFGLFLLESPDNEPIKDE